MAGNSLNKALIRCVSEYSEDPEGFFRELNRIILKEGDRTFVTLLKILTHLDFDTHEAKRNWQDIVEHQRQLTKQLGRPVHLLMTICDYFLWVNKAFQVPKMIELNDYERTAKSSNIDRLTGLYNRGYFDEALDIEVKRSRRYGTGFSLVFFDLDNFKQINDTMGHQMGDMVLRRVGELVLREKRSEDIAARYGGEEILIILPESNKVQALVIAERIRQNIARLELQFYDRTFGVSVSGGLASFPKDAETGRQLVQCADKAMYVAKANGKNNVALYSLDKRTFFRAEFLGQVQVHNLQLRDVAEKVVFAKNLSVGGILFESAVPYNLGDHVQLQFNLPDNAKNFTIFGTVVRVETFGLFFDIGVAFLKVSGEMREELAQYLSRQSNLRNNS